VFLVVGIIVAIILTILAYLASPSNLTVAELARVTAGGTTTITYSVTADFASTSANTRTLEVAIRENDPALDDRLIDGVVVSVPPGARQGSATFTLVCGPSSLPFVATYLEGTNGTSYEDDHEVYAEYGRVLLWDVESDDVKTDCRAALGLGE
jgi:hypothetical protein